MLHTHTFCAADAAVAGSWFMKEMSARPVMRALLGTDAVIVILPVDVAPSVPWVAADAGTAEKPAAAARADIAPAKIFRLVTFYTS